MTIGHTKPAPPPSREEAREPLRDRAAPGETDEHSALLRVAAACAGANRLEDVLELAAEEARHAVGADSLSVGRFEADGGWLKVLINVGELSELEEPFPEDESYALGDYPLLARMLADGEPYFTATDASDADRSQVRLLEALGKSSDLAVPIIVEGVIWGEIWTAKAIGEPPFRAEDISFLELVADQIATAIARAEMFGRVSRLAYEDPLTGLPNRRAFEERLDRALARLRQGDSLSLLVCDLDGLKQINDSRGHAAGDRALEATAGALVRTAANQRGAFAARLAGDEFCVLLEGHNLFEAVSMGMAALKVIGDAGETGAEPISFSCGAASAQPGTTASELLRGADAALYAAKRRGGGRVCSVAETVGESLIGEPAVPAATTSAQGRLERIVDTVAAALEGPLAAATPVDRLELVANAFTRAWNFASWAISIVPPRGDVLIDIANGWNREAGSVQGMRFAAETEQYPLADYPLSATLIAGGTGSFTVAADDPDADPAEVEMLHGVRMDVVVSAVATCGEGAFMVEMFGDAETAPLDDAERALRLLTQAALPPLSADDTPSAAASRIELAERIGAHARELTAAGDVLTASAVTARHLAAAYDCHAVHVVERTGAELRLRAEVLRSGSSGDWRQASETGLVGRALRERAPVICADVLREPAFRGTEATRGVRSELVVPVGVSGKQWGVVNLEHVELSAFDDEDVSIVEAFAEQFAARLAALGEGLGADRPPA